jgi:hypothetical protein
VGRIVAAYDKFEADHADTVREEQGVALSTPPHRPGR